MTQSIESAFATIGARASVFRMPVRSTTLNVLRDERGEYFAIGHGADVLVEALDADAADRHLLLAAKAPWQEQSAFLCGHDERAWFVAAIPESARALTVDAAKDALKPAAVWDAIREFGVPMEQRNLRRTAAFVRQGEWFFIPRADARVNPNLVLRNEPIQRGAGNPHLCQFLFRRGGQRVFVNDNFPNGLTGSERRALPKADRGGYWREMVRDARPLVRGSISHKDHETVTLRFWHEVVMNTENEARAMNDVRFLD